MADAEPRSRSLTARPPRNLLQWLQRREIRPIQNYNLPVSIYRSLRKSLTLEENNLAHVQLMIVMKLKSIREQQQFGRDFITMHDSLQDLWLKINKVIYYQNFCFNVALDNGLLEIMFSLLRAFHTPSQYRVRVCVRKEYIKLFLSVIADALIEPPYRFEEYIVSNIESIIYSEGLLIFLGVISVYECLSFRPILHLRIQHAICLSENLRLEKPDVFYPLWRKFKEGLYIAVTSSAFGHTCHAILRVNNTVENLVHEAYCLASCVESLFGQPMHDEVRHIILTASRRLQNLLQIIHGLLIVYPRHCTCDTCRSVAQRITCAGLPRLLHVLVVNFRNVSTLTDLDLIEPTLNKLSAILNCVTKLGFSQDLWYVIYTASDIAEHLRIRGEPIAELENHIDNFKEMLVNSRFVRQCVEPAKYILEPPFQRIAFDLDRTISLCDQIHVIEHLNHFCYDRDVGTYFIAPLYHCFSAIYSRTLLRLVLL